MHRRLITLDETCVSINGLKHWVYAAIDRNEILSMRVFPSRNALTTKIFVELLGSSELLTLAPTGLGNSTITYLKFI
jgi:transposase-like protein